MRRNPVSKKRFPRLVKAIFAESKRLYKSNAIDSNRWRTYKVNPTPFKSLEDLSLYLGVDVDYTLFSMFACALYEEGPGGRSRREIIEFVRRYPGASIEDAEFEYWDGYEFDIDEFLDESGNLPKEPTLFSSDHYMRRHRELGIAGLCPGVARHSTTYRGEDREGKFSSIYLDALRHYQSVFSDIRGSFYEEQMFRVLDAIIDSRGYLIDVGGIVSSTPNYDPMQRRAREEPYKAGLGLYRFPGYDYEGIDKVKQEIEWADQYYHPADWRELQERARELGITEFKSVEQMEKFKRAMDRSRSRHGSKRSKHGVGPTRRSDDYNAIAILFVREILFAALFIYAADPSTSGKYSLWLAKVLPGNLGDGYFYNGEDVRAIRSNLETFEAIKGSLDKKDRDINSYKTYKSFYKKVFTLKDKTKKDKAREELEVFYEDDRWKIYKVNRFEDEKKALKEHRALMTIAKDTGLCVQYPNNARDYMETGDLYPIYKKEYTESGKPWLEFRYLLAPESAEFTDTVNSPVTLDEARAEGFLELPFFKIGLGLDRRGLYTDERIMFEDERGDTFIF